MKLLIIDDNRTVRDILKFILNKKYTLIEAAHAFDALTILERENVSIILLDNEMPYMNGIELLPKIRIKYPQIPVLMMSADSDENLVKKAISSGAYSFIRKPFNLTELTSILMEMEKSVIQEKIYD